MRPAGPPPGPPPRRRPTRRRAGGRMVAIGSRAQELRDAIDPFVAGLGAEFVWVPAQGGDVTVIGPTGGRTRPHFTSDTSRIYSYGVIPGETFRPRPPSPGDRAGIYSEGVIPGETCQPGPPPPVALVSTRWDNTDLKRHLRVMWRLPVTAAAWPVSDSSDLLMPRDFSP